MDPAIRNTDLFSYFIQDEITLQEDRWYLTAGSKFEHNDFTGFEFQPTIRLLHMPSEREAVWAAISRPVRTPSRFNHDGVFRALVSPVGPTFVEIRGDDSTVAEELLAYELGYRAQPSDDFSWDVAVFYNNYDNLISSGSAGAPFPDPGIPAIIIPLRFTNLLTADSFGAEFTSTYQVHCNWELSGAYSLFYLDVHGRTVGFDSPAEGSSPHNRVYVRSSWDLRRDLELDLIGRYVDNLLAQRTSSYLTMDVRLAWRPNNDFEWAVVGRNLLDSPHKEFADLLPGDRAVEVEPEVFTALTWTR